MLNHGLNLPDGQSIFRLVSDPYKIHKHNSEHAFTDPFRACNHNFTIKPRQI